MKAIVESYLLKIKHSKRGWFVQRFAIALAVFLSLLGTGLIAEDYAPLPRNTEIAAIEDFGEVIRTWQGGGGDLLASNPDNWLEGEIPVDGDSVVMDANSSGDCTWDIDVELHNWTQTVDYEGTITFATVYPGQGAFTNLVISRDVDLQGGVWTHAANPSGSVEVNRLAVIVGGDFVLGAAATIDLAGKGYASGYGPGSGTAGGNTAGYSASHGGSGARNRDGYYSYGSPTRPMNLGSGAAGRGGGALMLRIGGYAEIEGAISAIGEYGVSVSGKYNHGSGGSIFIEADDFSGNGSINAGVSTVATYYASGGGRIALISRSDSDFSTLEISAKTHNQGRNGGGRSGTIFLATPSSKRLVIDQNNIGAVSENTTDILPYNGGDILGLAFDSELVDVALVATNGAFVRITHDLRIGDIAWLEGTLSLNGNTLYIVAPEPVGIFPNEFGNGTIDLPGIIHVFDNDDSVIRDGRLLWDDQDVTWRATSVVYGEEGGATEINGGLSEGYFVSGTELAFTALADGGYSFIHWDGNIEGASRTKDNPLVVSEIYSNLAFRAWFRDDSLDMSTNTWLVPSNNEDWFDPINWSLFSVPVAGQTVVLPAGTVALATNSPAKLNGIVIDDGAVLTTGGWNTKIEADDIIVKGTVTHLPHEFSDPDPITGEWIPQHRVWLAGHRLTVEESGEINVDHKGYQPGNGPGTPLEKGDGWRGGGGYGGSGASGNRGEIFGETNGIPNDPWQPGSGGGPTSWSSAGATGRPAGGAIRIDMSGAVTVNGTISANGQNGGCKYGTSGSGGGIAIYCKTLQGSATGLIRADGGRACWDEGGGGGGGGRIALHYNPVAQRILPNPRPPIRISTYAWPYSLNGVTRTLYTVMRAQMGTLWMPDTTLLADSPDAPAILEGQRFWHVRLEIGDNFDSWSPESLVVSNCVVGFRDGFVLDVSEDVIIGGDLPVLKGSEEERAALFFFAENNEELYGTRLAVGGDLTLTEGGWVNSRTDGLGGSFLGIRVAGDATVGVGAGIDVSEEGYLSQSGNGNGPGAGTGNECGGAYGGASGGSVAAAIYGIAEMPVEPGSPGGHRPRTGGPYVSGRGGGALHLLVGGSAIIDGAILADGGVGTYYRGAGGSGGGVFVTAGRRLAGIGHLSANGGKGYTTRSPGGGGRIALWHGVPLPVVESRIASRNVSGMSLSKSYTHFMGTYSADGVETSVSGYLDSEPGTFGIYTTARTIIILR